MKKYTFEQVVQLAENALARIKRSPENPYKNLKFVDKIFESASPSTRQDIKNLLRGNFKGHLQENVFSTPSPSKPQHLYNYLYENNMLSKYDELAEYMDFPSVTELQNEGIYDEISYTAEDPMTHIKKMGLSPEQYNVKREEIYLSPKEVDAIANRGIGSEMAVAKLKKLGFKFMDAPMHQTTPETPAPKKSETPASPSKPKKQPPYDRSSSIFTGSGPTIATDYYIDNNIKEEYDDDQYEYDENMRIEDEIEKIKQDMLDMPLGQKYIQGDDNIIELILIPDTEYEYDVLYNRESIGRMVVTAVDDEIQAIDFEAKSWNPLQESEKKNPENELTNKDYSGQDLQGVDFSWQDLSNANFEGANLEHANFIRARLLNARFENANLKNTKFKGATLWRANLKNADLTGARFENTNLANTNFENATLIKTNFEEADFTHSNLLNANLQGARLYLAYLKSAMLANTILIKADLEGATLTYANLFGANLQGANLQEVEFTNARLDNANFEDADLSGATFSGAILKNANFKGADLLYADFEGAENVPSGLLRESEGNVEYVIWGVPPNEEEEKLLLANLEGKPVTDIDVAKNLKSVLEKKHGCTNVRIQTVDLSDNDFSAFKKP